MIILQCFNVLCKAQNISDAFVAIAWGKKVIQVWNNMRRVNDDRIFFAWTTLFRFYASNPIKMMNIVFLRKHDMRTHVCMHVCLFDLHMLHCHGDLKQGKYLVWDLLCFGEAWFSSVPVTCCKNTHTAISQNAFQQHTQTHLNPMNPIFFFFPPTSLSSSLCLSRISAVLSRLPSVHLLIRSTGSSGNVQMLFTA